MIRGVVPAGLSDESVKAYMRMKRPDLFGAPTSLKNMPGNARQQGAMVQPGPEGMEADPNNPHPTAGLPGYTGNRPVRLRDLVPGAVVGGTAATVMGGPLLAQVARAHPAIASTLAIEASHYLPGAAGRIARKIPSWTGMLAGGKGGRAAAAEEEVAAPPFGESRTLPGMNLPESIRPPAAPIPPRSGLMLPASSEPLPSMTETPGGPSLREQVMSRLRQNAANIPTEEGAPYAPPSSQSMPFPSSRPLMFEGQEVPPDTPMTDPLTEAVRRINAAKGRPASSTQSAQGVENFDPFDEMAAYQPGRSAHDVLGFRGGVPKPKK